MIAISDINAFEILDSRSRPTLSVALRLADGRTCGAGVPSGASTGSGEAVELRDEDPTRYWGQGVRHAVENVTGAIRAALAGRAFTDLAELDQTLLDLDGTENKARLGANAIVGVSMAAARAFAAAAGEPLWRYLTPAGVTPALPVPHFNVINGGVHAPNRLDFQEFLLAPLGMRDFADAVRAGAEIYAALRARLTGSGHATGLGDEGGFAPDLAHPEEALDLLVDAIIDAGYYPGPDGVAIALDPAASEFYRDGAYHVAGQTMSANEMVRYYSELVDRYPIWSIEDGLAEADWEGWKHLTEELGQRVQLVGDDIFVTSPKIIAEAARQHVANAALIKVNQVGTVTETLEALALCRQNAYAAMVSHDPERQPTPSSPTSPSDQGAGNSRQEHRPWRAGRQVQPVASDRRSSPCAALTLTRDSPGPVRVATAWVTVAATQARVTIAPGGSRQDSDNSARPATCHRAGQSAALTTDRPRTYSAGLQVAVNRVTNGVRSGCYVPRVGSAGGCAREVESAAASAAQRRGGSCRAPDDARSVLCRDRATGSHFQRGWDRPR